MLLFAHFLYSSFPLLIWHYLCPFQFVPLSYIKSLKNKIQQNTMIIRLMQILVYVVFKYLGLPSLYTKLMHENI